MTDTTINTVGVVGAGVMGRGLAQDLASHGLQVILVDVDRARLDDAMRAVRHGLRAASLMRPSGSPAPDNTAILARIAPVVDLEELGRADFVIENVTEKWSVKQALYPRLDQVCREGVVFAANTSAIPITRLAALTARMPQVLGMHFMNPVPMKPTVEVIRGFHTAEGSLRAAHELLSRMGKKGIEVNDSPGFVSNRVLMLTINEAIFLLHEGVADASNVDRIFRDCFGHPMGPLATADLIGLDTILQSIEVLHDAFGDSKYRPCPLLKTLVEAGLHGRKTGRGFFSY